MTQEPKKDKYDIAEEERLAALRAAKREQLAKDAERKQQQRKAFAAEFEALGMEYAGIAAQNGRKQTAKLASKLLDAAKALNN